MTTQQKQLAGLFCLDHNIKLYIPSTLGTCKGHDKFTHGTFSKEGSDKFFHMKQCQADNSDYIRRALVLFSDLFGGATSYDAAGAWNSTQLGLIVESVKIVESYATKEAIQSGLVKVIEYAKLIKSELKQEAVSLEYDNKLYLL